MQGQDSAEGKAKDCDNGTSVMTKAVSLGHSRSGSGGEIRHTYTRDLLTSFFLFLFLSSFSLLLLFFFRSLVLPFSQTLFCKVIPNSSWAVR